jgi:mycothiol synthase
VNVRPLTRADAGLVAAIAAADEEALRGHPSRTQARDVLSWWTRVDFDRESWLFEENGEPVAFGWFELHGDIGTYVGVVAQGQKGRGHGAALVELGESAARTAQAAKIHTWAPTEDAAAAALFADRGYREVRRFYEMAIELQQEPAAPTVPEPFVLEPFRAGDARAFHATMNEAFQDHWEWHGLPFDEWWEMRQGQDADEAGPLWFVVRDGDEMAACIRNEANRNGGGFVGLIGVRRPWRGRGLAKALLQRTFVEFWRRASPRVSLGVDAESPTGATKLYESVGMTVESAMAVFEKE